MAEMVSRVFVEIDGTEYEAESINEDLDAGGKPVPVMNRRNRAIGHVFGVPVFTFTITLKLRADMDMDPHELARKQTEFSVGVEYNNWKSRKYLDATITKLSIASKTGDAVEFRLDCDALDCI